VANCAGHLSQLLNENFPVQKIRPSTVQSKRGFLIASAAAKESGRRKVVHSVNINIPNVAWRLRTAECSIDFHQHQSWLSAASNKVPCFVGSLCVSYSHYPRRHRKVIEKNTKTTNIDCIRSCIEIKEVVLPKAATFSLLPSHLLLFQLECKEKMNRCVWRRYIFRFIQ